MAKPNDTRFARPSANQSNNSSTATTGTHAVNPANPATPNTPRPSELEAVIATLRSRQARAEAVPKAPKSARRPHIKARRRVTVSASLSAESMVEIPTIRLCGHWLVPAGFDIRSRVRVHVMQGALILLAEDAD